MKDTEIFYADGNSPKMIEAFKNAQNTFKYFWRELSWEYRRIVPALNVACVKIAFTQETDKNNAPIIEHMWINEVEFEGNHVKGVLINSPHELTNISNGDLVDIPLNHISDWLFAIAENKPKGGLSKLFSSTPKPKVYGGFTIQAMRSEMTNQERKEHDNAWGLDFGDYNEVLLVNEQKEKPENLIEHPMSKNMREKLFEFLKENPNEIVNADEHGLTLLHKEAIAGNLTSIEVLLSVGADKNEKTKQGEMALDFAKKMNWEHIIPVLEK
ncbi:DUF2314 domain-containing protein [Pedobacter sp. PLR]|uniref:DUF2314 domain-containing protein n=1 Tax=Pedobacter sp. PLR TaxID=2994465 RepID=UPI0022476E9E|nr:DUF2314 domain-containing protein [Pedobacter sp. PLR]MCX2449706.1 DUF2314 domain-containing protein [Pedobacter sp. PLR]